VLTLNIGGRPQLALTKTVVTHPIRPYIEHVDLLVVRRGEKVTVEVQVVVTGEGAPGSLITQDLNTLEIQADAMSIPERIEVSVEDVQAGTQILAGSIPLPEGSELKTDPDALVVNVIAAPSEADLEAEVDTEGAGVIEEPSAAEAGEGSNAGASSAADEG
jgi:large subunit ribosomal protein L25